MTQMPIQKIIPRMAVPTIISMLISSFTTWWDTIYVGHLDNTESSAAVGVAFSFMALIQAIGFFFGHGSGNFISRSLGKKEYDKAKNMAATGFFLPIAVGTLIMVLGLLFTTPLSRMLGATETALPYTNSYLRWLLLGTPFMMSSLVMNNQLRLQGSAQIAMVGITFGAVLNIALDPVFIFKLGMGVGGAALATIISQFISWLLLLGMCAERKYFNQSEKPVPSHLAVRGDRAVRAPVTLPSGNRKRCGDRFKLGSEGIRRLSHRGVFHRVQDHHLRGFGHDRFRSGLSACLRLQLWRRTIRAGRQSLLVLR